MSLRYSLYINECPECRWTGRQPNRKPRYCVDCGSVVKVTGIIYDIESESLLDSGEVPSKLPGMVHSTEQYSRLADYCIENRLFKGHDGSHTDSVIREIERLTEERDSRIDMNNDLIQNQHVLYQANEELEKQVAALGLQNDLLGKMAKKSEANYQRVARKNEILERALFTMKSKLVGVRRAMGIVPRPRRFR